MRLPPWATPPKSYPNRRRCDCDYHFPSICTVKARALGHSFVYHLCRPCLVYEREIRGEITFAQSERWSRRLIAVHLERGDYYVPPPPKQREATHKHGKRRRKRKADAIPVDVPHMPM